jgi:exodeoxyribonuclease-3
MLVLIMKILTWNVNGLRAIIKKNLYDYINNENPDIICLNEIKLHDITIEEELRKNINKEFQYYYWNVSNKKGYSGTCVISKIKPIKTEYQDEEGRLITCHFKKFILVNVYCMNAGEDLKRLDHKIKIWNVVFKNYILKLQKENKVIITGDLNVAQTEMDIFNPLKHLKSAGYTEEERISFNNLLDETKLVDIYRYLNPKKIIYSYWSYRQSSRNKNHGWRIDYFLIDKKLIKKVINTEIKTEILGSDHAPIILEINI